MTNIQKVASIWPKLMGTNYYLPAFSGSQNAAARATILSTLHGVKITKAQAGVDRLRSDLYVAMNCDMTQCAARVQDEFEFKMRELVTSSHS